MATRTTGAAVAAMVVALAAFLAISVATPSPTRAQCGDVVGDSAFSGDPRPPCIAPPPPLPPIRFGASLRLGVHESGDAPLSGPTYGLGLYTDVALTRWLGLGARFGYQAGGGAGLDMDGDGSDDAMNPGLSAIVVTGGPRFTLFTQEARHEALRLGVSAGGLLVTDGPFASGPLLELTLERQAGNLLVQNAGYDEPSHGTSYELGLGFRLQQGLGDASDYRAVFVETFFGGEVFSRVPHGEPPPARKPRFEYTFSAAGHFGFSPGELGSAGAGLRLGVGFPIAKLIALQIASDAKHVGRADGGDGSTHLSIMGGFRIPRWWLLSLQVMAGYDFAYGTEPLETEGGAVLDFLLAAQIPNLFGCGVGAFIGPSVTVTLVDAEGDQSRTWVYTGATVGMRYDNLIRASECRP